MVNNIPLNMVYESVLDNACHTDNLDFVEKNKAFLRKTIFNLKDSKLFVNDITYRKINDWDSKGLISDTRDSEKCGWRKFSIIGIVRLKIISGLRKIGISTEKIAVILDNIKVHKPYNKEEFKDAFPQLEYFIFDSLNGYKNYLIIDEE